MTTLLLERGSDVFAYDQANRLTSATVSGVTSTDTYDGDGKRANQTVGSTTTNYIYDINNSLPNVLTDGTFKYVYGLGLAYAVDGSGNVQVYHTDGLGSVRAITNGSGTLVQTYQTDEFGIPTSSQGTSTQPFEYTGQQVDSNGLVYLRARYYDPAIGTFVTRDSTGGQSANPQSQNHYSYAVNSPAALVDPRGLSANRVARKRLAPALAAAALTCEEVAFPGTSLCPDDKTLLALLAALISSIGETARIQTDRPQLQVYYRLENDTTQTAETATMQETSGEIWGRASQGAFSLRFRPIGDHSRPARGGLNSLRLSRRIRTVPR